jgi:ABC-type sugar transport system ATPase subunit
MTPLKLDGVVKRHGDIETIHGINLDIAAGSFTVFVGPSGCGKSTLLRMIAGLEPITAGRISIGLRDVTELPPGARRVAMVFQSYALYPHMTVRENLSFGMRMRGVPKATINEKLDMAVEMLRLAAYLDRKPAALSGGQAQRVAIGRALVQDPDVFLFDEPLSNLDAELRLKTRLEIAALHKRIGKTMIYVTHDQVEAMTLADQIVVLKDGVVEQVGAPITLYEQPVNQFVAGFIGSPAMNMLPVSLLRDAPLATTHAATVGLRPEHLTLTDAGVLHGAIERIEHLGATAYAYVQLKGSDTDATVVVTVELRGEARARIVPGAAVSLAFEAQHAHYFDRAGCRV